MKNMYSSVVLVVLSIFVDNVRPQDHNRQMDRFCYHCVIYSKHDECTGDHLTVEECNELTDFQLMQTLKRMFPSATLPELYDLQDKGDRQCVIFKNKKKKKDYYERRSCVFPGFQVCDIMGPEWICEQCKGNKCNGVDLATTTSPSGYVLLASWLSLRFISRQNVF